MSCRQKNTYEHTYLSLENKVQELISNEELIGAEILIIENQKETFHKSFGWGQGIE